MDKTTLKSYFQNGDKPTESNFSDLIDSLSDNAVYGSGWSSITDIAPSKSAVYNKIETLLSNGLSSATIYVGNSSNQATAVSLSGEATLSNTGALTLQNSAVIGKVLTGYTSGAGTVAATDTILQAIQKLNGNNALKIDSSLTSGYLLIGNGSNVAAPVLPSGEVALTNAGVFTISNSAVIGKLLTGFASTTGTISSADSVLTSIQKLYGNANALGSTYVKLINGNVDFIYYSTDSFSLTNDLGGFAKSWLFYDTSLTKLGFGSSYIGITTSGFQFVGPGVAFGNFTPTAGVCGELRTASNSDIGFIIRGQGSGSVYTQTGDLTRWLSYNGTSTTIVAKVDKDGNITAPNFFLNGAGPLVPYKFFHEAPTNKSYTIDAKTVDSRTLLQIRGLKTASGTCTIAIKINGTAVTWTGSVTSLNVTSVAQDVVIISGGTYATGDRITVTITSAASPVDLEFALK